jgi:flagellar protein FliO/FliZ
MDGLLTALRVVVALAVVVALVWYLARRFGGRGRDASREASVRVVDRQSLSRHSGVAVVAAGERRLLVGFAEQGVQLITELRPVSDLSVSDLSVPDLSDLSTLPAAPAALSSSTPAMSETSGARAPEVSDIAGRTTKPKRAPAPAPVPAGVPGNRQPGVLAGSVLSPQTWHATVRALQDRTVRR